MIHPQDVRDLMVLEEQEKLRRRQDPHIRAEHPKPTDGCTILALSKCMDGKTKEDVRTALNISLFERYSKELENIEKDPNACAQLRGWHEDGSLRELAMCQFGDYNDETYSETVVHHAAFKHLGHDLISLRQVSVQVEALRDPESKLLIFGAINPNFVGCKSLRGGLDLPDDEHAIAVVNGRIWCTNLTKANGAYFSLKADKNLKIRVVDADRNIGGVVDANVEGERPRLGGEDEQPTEHGSHLGGGDERKG
ncbi:hypothetical protein CYMTET_7215 [Cymbomonas tetramitiformis]|uniref:Uncharacterized protein n=1 Tax=Cymbomonas tetramitiformis TaxID=36881 RepID=A0AAE0GW35_9CHLO|nr:hypothetical protein CYMTET_7215 [Cymbomonas tetramitiformis]